VRASSAKRRERTLQLSLTAKYRVKRPAVISLARRQSTFTEILAENGGDHNDERREPNEVEPRSALPKATKAAPSALS